MREQEGCVCVCLCGICTHTPCLIMGVFSDKVTFESGKKVSRVNILRKSCFPEGTPVHNCELRSCLMCSKNSTEPSMLTVMREREKHFVVVYIKILNIPC